MDVCLHDDGVKGLVDAPPACQQAGEEAPGPQFRDGEFQVTGLCVVTVFSRCPLRQVARVSVSSPLGADLRGGLRLDQFLQQPLGDLADEFKIG